MGRQKAAHLILAGERMTAQELESAGMISKIIPKEKFLEDVLAIGRRIAALPPQSLKVNKQMMTSFWKPRLEKANELEHKAFGEMLATATPKLAAQTFLKEQALKNTKQGIDISKL